MWLTLARTSKSRKSGKLGPDDLLGGRQQPFALGALAGQLARPTNSLGLLPGALLRRLFVVHVPLHLAERAFTLHLFLEGFQGLIDIVVANEDLYQGLSPDGGPARAAGETNGYARKDAFRA